jgi:hypothetical protein
VEEVEIESRVEAESVRDNVRSWRTGGEVTVVKT